MLVSRILDRWLTGDVLGIVVGDRELAASLVREGTVVWSGSAICGDPDSFAAVLRTLLATAPGRILARRRVHVLIAEARAPTKVLPGVSSAVAERDPSSVRSMPERYFLCVPGTVEMSTLWISPSSDVWATAFRRPDIEDLRAVLSELGWSTSRIASETAWAISSEGGDPSRLPRTVDEARVSERANAVALEERTLRPVAQESQAPRAAVGSRGLRRVTLFVAALVAGVSGAEYATLRLDSEMNERNSRAFYAAKRTRDSIGAAATQRARVADFEGGYPSVLVQMHSLARVVDTMARIQRWTSRDSLIDLSLVAANGAALPALVSTIPWVRDAWLVGGITRSGAADDADQVVLRIVMRSETEHARRTRRDSSVHTGEL
jgi:hypothetical protein